MSKYERDRQAREWGTRLTLGLWALYTGASLPISTGLRVLAWGTGTAGSIEGSIPGSWHGPVGGAHGIPDNYLAQPEIIGGVTYGPQDSIF